MLMTVARRVVPVVCLFLAVLLPSAAAAQQASPPTIRRFLELTGAAQLSVRAMETMLPAQRAANPQIPAAFWDAFMARARRDMHQLIDSLVPIYATHFTQVQMEQLVRFYESPLGRHLTTVQPQLNQVTMETGQRWGAVIGQQVAESLARAGVTLPR
jgi:hypothetical protein